MMQCDQGVAAEATGMPLREEGVAALQREQEQQQANRAPAAGAVAAEAAAAAAVATKHQQQPGKQTPGATVLVYAGCEPGGTIGSGGADSAPSAAATAAAAAAAAPPPASAAAPEAPKAPAAPLAALAPGCRWGYDVFAVDAFMPALAPLRPLLDRLGLGVIVQVATPTTTPSAGLAGFEGELPPELRAACRILIVVDRAGAKALPPHMFEVPAALAFLGPGALALHIGAGRERARRPCSAQRQPAPLSQPPAPAPLLQSRARVRPAAARRRVRRRRRRPCLDRRFRRADVAQRAPPVPALLAQLRGGRARRRPAQRGRRGAAGRNLPDLRAVRAKGLPGADNFMSLSSPCPTPWYPASPLPFFHSHKMPCLARAAPQHRRAQRLCLLGRGGHPAAAARALGRGRPVHCGRAGEQGVFLPMGEASKGRAAAAARPRAKTAPANSGPAACTAPRRAACSSNPPRPRPPPRRRAQDVSDGSPVAFLAAALSRCGGRLVLTWGGVDAAHPKARPGCAYLCLTYDVSSGFKGDSWGSWA